MTRNQKVKPGVALAVISYGTQLALMRPLDPWWVWLPLGTLSLSVTVGFLLLCHWMTRP